ncbi:MAG: 5-oxoprolinase subunit C family protein [Chthoniobacterales bacterium]
MTITIERAGFVTTVQDLGRVGHRASGVSLGGALDPHAMRVANLLVGNDENCAGLEVTLGTACLRFTDDRLVAWCGGPFEAQFSGQNLLSGRAAVLHAGNQLELQAPPNGARAWLAISGGIDVPLVLGSRATDLRSKFGGLDGRALRDGDQLPLGQPSENTRRIAQKLSDIDIGDWTAPNEWSNTRSSHGFLRFLRGAEWSEFPSGALTDATFAVSPDSDRMGARLIGPALGRESRHDLISEPVAPGTIQVPHSGQPILLLGDCQTIGGYPKIAHVITVDLPAAAQLRPGDEVRFAEVSLGEAQRLLIARERELERFRIGLNLRTRWS